MYNDCKGQVSKDTLGSIRDVFLIILIHFKIMLPFTGTDIFRKISPVQTKIIKYSYQVEFLCIVIQVREVPTTLNFNMSILKQTTLNFSKPTRSLTLDLRSTEQRLFKQLAYKMQLFFYRYFVLKRPYTFTECDDCRFLFQSYLKQLFYLDSVSIYRIHRD